MRSLKAIAVIALTLSTLIGVVISSAEAVTLQISKSNLGQPFYRSINKLSLSSSNSEQGSVTVKFLNRNELALEVQENIKVKKADWVPCSGGKCIFNIYELPFSLEKYSCSIEVKFLSPSGQAHLISKEIWGDCVAMPAIPDTKYLPDFVFPEGAYFSENATIDLLNIGSNYLQKPLIVWGVLKDSESNVIWKGINSNLVTINSHDTYMVDFQSELKTWQNRLACTGEFFIEPEFNTFERSKLNNSLQIEYGSCEDVPSEARGDKIDFEPFAEIVNGVLSLQAVNNGRLPYLEETTRLESYIRYLNQDRQIIFKKNLFTAPKIHGFGDAKEVIQDAIPAGTCSVEIELNPNLTIKESNYINNRIELKVCE